VSATSRKTCIQAWSTSVHVVSFGLVWVKHVKCLKHSSPLSVVQSVLCWGLANLEVIHSNDIKRNSLAGCTCLWHYCIQFQCNWVKFYRIVYIWTRKRCVKFGVEILGRCWKSLEKLQSWVKFFWHTLNVISLPACLLRWRLYCSLSWLRPFTCIWEWTDLLTYLL